MALKNQIRKLNNGKHPEADTPTIPEFYSNSIVVNASAFEFELQHLLVDSQARVKGALNVRLSPQTAWALYRALEAQIHRYEKTTGEIALPDEVKRAFK